MHSRDITTLILGILLITSMTTMANAGTWSSTNWWTNGSFSWYADRCQLTPDESSVWLNALDESPSKVVLSSPTTQVSPDIASFYSAQYQYPKAVATLKSGSNDSLYTGGHLGRVWRGVDSSFVRITDLPNGRTVNDLAFDVYGKLWAATDSLAYRLVGNTWEPIGKASDYGTSPKTTHLAADPRGGMWIGSDGKGLLLHKQQAFRKEFPLGVRTLQVMGNGTVIVGRWAPIARIPYNSATYEEIDDGAISNGGWTQGAFEDAAGGIWIGHPNMIVYRDPVGNWSIDSVTHNQLIQTFSKIREEDFYYVDKTPFVYKMEEEKFGFYFLSRPRRFGKSLFLDTLRQAYLGKKEHFKGLFLENHWDWSKRRAFCRNLKHPSRPHGSKSRRAHR